MRVTAQGAKPAGFAALCKLLFAACQQLARDRAGRRPILVQSKDELEDDGWTAAKLPKNTKGARRKCGVRMATTRAVLS
jgi:hypothetical protein